MSVTDDRPTRTCPTWCRADQDDDLRQRREKALDIVAVLLRTDGVLVAPLVDTYRLHVAEVGPGHGPRWGSTRIPPSCASWWRKSRGRHSSSRPLRWPPWGDHSVGVDVTPGAASPCSSRCATDTTIGIA